ncbi:MAG TPA: hypothetical protein VFZ81_14480 [Burkholderiales bacterium]
MIPYLKRAALLAALALAACGASEPTEVLEIQPQKPAAQAPAPQAPAANPGAALPEFSALVKKAARRWST